MVLKRAIWSFAAIILLGSAFAGCSRDPVVARVNGEAITQKDVNIMLRHAGIKEGAKTMQAGNTHSAIQQELLNQLIIEKLVLQAAQKENIRATKDEVIKAYNDMLRAFPKEDDYLKNLKQRGFTKDMLLKSMEKDMTVGKFKESIAKNIVVDDRELQAYYESNLSAFRVREQVLLSIIKVITVEEAKNIKREIEKGESFEKIADKYPAGHAEKGGNMGWITLDTFPQDMAKEIRKIKAGSLGGPIKGREGWYIVKVHEKQDETIKPFNDVKEDIRQILTQHKKREQFHIWLQDAKKNAKIEIVGQK